MHIRKIKVFLSHATLLIFLFASAFSFGCSSTSVVRGDWNPDQLGISSDSVIIFVSNRDAISSDENRDIYSVKPDGTELTRLTNHNAHVWQLRLSPDGSKIVFRTDRSGERAWWIMNRDGSDERVLLEDGWLNPVWLPDNSRLGYQLDDDIYVINADGSGTVNLTSEIDAKVSWRNWSPDSNKLVFRTKRDYYMVNTDGSDLTQLNDFTVLHMQFWSPDSSKIAYLRKGDMYVVDADGSNEQRLTDSGGASKPVWSPDSQKILYSKSNYVTSGYFTPKTADLWVMNSDGTNKQRLTQNESGNGQAIWTPDGNKIAYFSYDYSDVPDSNEKVTSLIFMNSDGTGKSTIAEDDGRSLRDLEWSKDKQRILCGCVNCYYSMNTDGGDLIMFDISSDDGYKGFSGWSPDGKSLLCNDVFPIPQCADSSNKDYNSDIYVMNADGVINITNDPDNIYDDSSPVWLP